MVTYISMTALRDASDFIRAQHSLFVIDACFSGTLLTRSEQSAKRFVTNLLTHSARQVITAGLEDQEVADSGGGQHSLFTRALLQNLESAAQETGIFTASDLAIKIREHVATQTSSQQTPQFGSLTGSTGGDMVFWG